MATAKRIYMTPGCAERMKAELKNLLYQQRPEMVETVAWAASNGDRSENADYHYGVFSIVGEDEIDLPKGRISWVSPIGKALLGTSEGDLITFRSPGGIEELEIARVEYKSLV